MDTDAEATGTRGEARVLGDEWEAWELADTESSESGKLRFLIILGAYALGTAVVLFLFNYLINPRLCEIHPAVARGVSYIIWTFALSAPLASLSTTLSSVAGRIPLVPGANVLFRWMSPGALWLGGKIGLKRDRLYHSFIKVHNSLVKAGTLLSASKGKVIMLLPRCLSPSMKKEIKQLAETYSLQTFTVGGGEAARRVLEKHKPTAVVALACERDLVSGIRDYTNRIPVIGVPNLRPEGPCRNTEVDLDRVERAITRFL